MCVVDQAATSGLLDLRYRTKAGLALLKLISRKKDLRAIQPEFICKLS